MYKIKQFIENVGYDRVVNSNLSVKNGIVFLMHKNISFKYEQGNWYQWTNRWVNLQGGVPDYETEELLDGSLFEKVQETVTE